MTISKSSMNKTDLSIIIPVFNSEKTLMELYQRIINSISPLNKTYEIIFVEDCSRDQSWDLLCELAQGNRDVTAIQLLKNSGQGNATLAGLEFSQGNIVVTLDDDLQFAPEEIPNLVQYLYEHSDVDVVIGAPVQRKDNWVRRLGSSFINRINSVLVQKDAKLRMTSFRAIRRQVVDVVLTLKIPYPALGLVLNSVTMRIKNIPVNHYARKNGKSNYSLWRILNQTLSNFIGYSVMPLHVLAFIGVIGILVSASLSVFYLVRYFAVGITVAGWTTLLLVLLALSGFNFFAFAILGEYLLRITQISANTSKWYVRNIVSASGDLESPDN
jgi:dolichol-phosphate mannosyltransferase/undecaprenyl-phosphate 4-deoxy-4-formamido-L-arabinose transferase